MGWNKICIYWYYEIPSNDKIEIDKLTLLENKIKHIEELLEKKNQENP